MKVTGLYGYILKTFEGECPLVLESEFGQERLESINAHILKQLEIGYSEDVLQILRNDRAKYLNDGTIQKIVELLEHGGKNPKGSPRGAPASKAVYWKYRLLTQRDKLSKTKARRQIADAIKADLKTVKTYIETHGRYLDNEHFTIDGIISNGVSEQQKANVVLKSRGRILIDLF